MNLRDFPRPKDDNGMGLHFRLDLTETDNKPYISQGVEWLQQIHVKWALVAGNDWQQIGKAAKQIWAAGIMPIARLVCKIDKPFIDWEAGVKTLQDLGIPPYLQIFNEPGDDREWNSHPDIKKFGDKWGSAAARVLEAGGYPGMGAVLGQDEWLSAFNSVQAAGRSDIWQKAWFCVHNYGSNHPPTYPYDDVNQNGTPATADEYAQYHFSKPLNELNVLRASSKHPGATIMDDDTSVLRFLEYKQWMVDSLGFCLPMIGGEGGWEWEVEEDLRYPKLPDEWHANYTREMFEWFKNGKLSNGVDLPDELFCCTPWIQADGQADSWWFGPLGTKQLTIDTVAAIPTFVRKFSWDAPAPSPEQPPIVISEPTQPSDSTPEPTPPTPPTDTTTAPPASAPEGMPPTEADATLSVQGTTLLEADTTVVEMDNETVETTSMVVEGTQLHVMTGFEYTVKQGETLWGISKKFGTTVEALTQANQLEPNTKLRAGIKLIIPR